MNKKVNKNTFFLLLLIFVVSAIGKIYQYTMSEAFGFGIMNYIRNGIINNKLVGQKAYDFPIKIFSVFKFLGFTTNLEWSIFFTLLFTPIMFFLLLKFKKYSLKQYIYIYFSMFVLSWTVFNANKDLIQLIFLLLIYGLFQTKLSNNKKILISAFIFFIESLVFREYYIIEAGLILICYYFLSKQIKNEKKLGIIKSVIPIFVIFFIGVYLCRFISYSSFDELINRRESLEDITGVTTIIKNVFSGNSTIFFIPNYIINFVRICLPIEIIKFGPKYIIFFIYQVFNISLLQQSIKKLNIKNITYVTLVLSYLIMLVASESDFGTLARHQSVLLMYYINLMKIKEGDINEKQKN